ncbi:MAG: hypothetical protein ACRDUY_02590 [Nitriliruptorales bacterium]
MSEMSRHLIASGNDLVEDGVRRLAAAQDRVAARLGRLTGKGWDVPANEVALERLLTTGHFLDRSGELEWTPREIAGHLRDTARVSTGQKIARLRNEADAHFEEFDTTGEERVASYAEIEPDDLTAELDAAQRELRGAVGSIDPEELDTATHETQDEVTLRSIVESLPAHWEEIVTMPWMTWTLRSIVEFLPAHWEEHADQLEAVTAEAIVS